MENYHVGVGKKEIVYKESVYKEIVYKEKGLYLAGFSDPDQKTTDTVQDIFARAFYVSALPGKSGVVYADPVPNPTQETSSRPVCIVVVDIWACSDFLKGLVIKRLEAEGISELSKENVMICGTHTHSAPGGYTGSKLYDSLLARPKTKVSDPISYDTEFSDIIANAIVCAIKAARDTAAPGKIYRGHTEIENCGMQRSIKAYKANPEAADQTLATTDTEMTLLKFVKMANYTDESETAIGILCWYPIHPTDLRQANKTVSGDNKGWAAKKVENKKLPTKAPGFVAGFANSNCGDVSGNVDVEIGNPPDSIGDQGRMEANGNLQANAALKIFDDPNIELIKGPINFFYKEEDFSAINIGETENRTWPPTLGMSMVAGSSEDSVSRYLDGDNIETVSKEDAWEGMTIDAEKGAPVKQAANALFINRTLYATAMAVNFGTKLLISGEYTNWMAGYDGEIVKGHGKKPIVFAPLDNRGYIPNALPLQLFQIGDCGIVGFPGELTTMAGRRLKKTLLKNFRPNKMEFKEFMLSCYANDYAQYVTTREEYDMQHYEGASTPFGPHTLAAFEQEFSEIDDEDARILKVTVEKNVFLSLSYLYVSAHGSTTSQSYYIGNGNSLSITLPDNAYNIKYTVSSKPIADGTIYKKGKIRISRGQTRKISVKNEPDYFKIDDPQFQVVRFKNASTFIVKVWVSYTVGNGEAVETSKESPSMDETKKFDLPWNARKVICKASHQGFWPNIQYYPIDDRSVKQRSGEISDVRVHADFPQKPTIKLDGTKEY